MNKLQSCSYIILVRIWNENSHIYLFFFTSLSYMLQTYFSKFEFWDAIFYFSFLFFSPLLNAFFFVYKRYDIWRACKELDNHEMCFCSNFVLSFPIRILILWNWCLCIHDLFCLRFARFFFYYTVMVYSSFFYYSIPISF